MNSTLSGGKMSPNQTLFEDLRSGLTGEQGTAQPTPYQGPSAASIADEEIFASDSAWNGTEPVTITVTQPIYDRMSTLIDRLHHLGSLAPNWDSYDAVPVQGTAAVEAMRLLAQILTFDVPTPTLVPTSSGGLQLEWHQDEAELELDVHPNGAVEVFLSMPNNQTWEGPLANSRWRLEAFLRHISHRS